MLDNRIGLHQYNAIPYTIQYNPNTNTNTNTNTIQYNTIQYNTIQYYIIQYKA